MAELLVGLDLELRRPLSFHDDLPESVSERDSYTVAVYGASGDFEAQSLSSTSVGANGVARMRPSINASEPLTEANWL